MFSKIKKYDIICESNELNKNMFIEEEKKTKAYNANISLNPRTPLSEKQLLARFQRVYGKVPTENEFRQFKESLSFVKEE